MTLPGAEASIKNATTTYGAEHVEFLVEGTLTIEAQQVADIGAIAPRPILRPASFHCTVTRSEVLCYYDKDRRRICIPHCCSQTCFFRNRAPVFNVPCYRDLPACS
jgi:hypothetical protein